MTVQDVVAFLFSELTTGGSALVGHEVKQLWDLRFYGSTWSNWQSGAVRGQAWPPGVPTRPGLSCGDYLVSLLDALLGRESLPMHFPSICVEADQCGVTVKVAHLAELTTEEVVQAFLASTDDASESMRFRDRGSSAIQIWAFEQSFQAVLPRSIRKTQTIRLQGEQVYSIAREALAK